MRQIKIIFTGVAFQSMEEVMPELEKLTNEFCKTHDVRQIWFDTKGWRVWIEYETEE